MNFTNGDRAARSVLLAAVAAWVPAARSAAQVQTPDGVWTRLSAMPEAVLKAEPWIRPKAGQALACDLGRLRAILGTAPLEFTPAAEKPLVVELPDPDGEVQRFEILLSPIMEPGLAFATTLLAATPNDGSETITVPNISTSNARIMVQSVGNVFYNVNAGTITITPGGCTGASVTIHPAGQTRCVGGAATFSDAADVAVCIADFNCSGAVSVQDIFDFTAGSFAADPRADVNHSEGINVQDIFDFMAAYFAGCS